MKTYILQEKVPSRSDFKWTFSRNCEGTEQLPLILSERGGQLVTIPKHEPIKKVSGVVVVEHFGKKCE